MYSYENAINLALNKFVILKQIYNENVEDYEDLPYVFYESEFVKYIMCKSINSDEKELVEIFDFIEDMLSNGDTEIVNLIEVAVVESLSYENNFHDFNKIASKFYGELTKKSFSMLD